MKNEINTVIIFCRFPSEGKVKSRLAQDTGEKTAAECYRLCAEHTFDECRKLVRNNTVCCIFYSEKGEEDKIKNWVGPGFEFFPQNGIDLGAKMTCAFKKVSEKNAGKAILIGTDIPDISADILKGAFYKLDSADVVIGPASDGGFYLFGAKRFVPGLFNGIKWGGGKVYGTVKRRLEEKNLKIGETAELIDIDTIDDVKLWLKNKSGNEDSSLKLQINKLFSERMFNL